jgi:hypothetical protein
VGRDGWRSGACHVRVHIIMFIPTSCWLIRGSLTLPHQSVGPVGPISYLIVESNCLMGSFSRVKPARLLRAKARTTAPSPVRSSPSKAKSSPLARVGLMTPAFKASDKISVVRSIGVPVFTVMRTCRSWGPPFDFAQPTNSNESPYNNQVAPSVQCGKDGQSSFHCPRAFNPQREITHPVCPSSQVVVLNW